MSKNKTVVILGAGSCGLTAGWELAKNGCKVIILEAKDDIGGLTGRKVINNNIYEYGTHVFHTDNIKFKSDLLDVVNNTPHTDRLQQPPYMFEFDRGSRLYIKFREKYFRYPLNSVDFIIGLPFPLLMHCTYDFIKYNMKDFLRRNKEYATGEEILIANFGKKLYEVFFKEYSRKQWGRPMSQMDPDLVRTRITRGDVFRVVKELIEKLGLGRYFDSHPQTERSIGKLYYTNDGIWGICSKLAKYIEGHNGEVRLNCNIQSVNSKADKVIVRYEGPEGVKEVIADELISTIPLPVFVNYFENASVDVTSAADKLEYRSLVVLGMLVNKRSVTNNAICFYFQDKVFNRLDEPTNHGLSVMPADKSILLSELACDFGDDVWNFGDDLVEDMIADLEKEKLIERKDILEKHKLKYRYAYPLYQVGYKENVNKVMGFLDSFKNIQTTGRQGKFVYVNMHVTMQMGLEAARRITEGNND